MSADGARRAPISSLQQHYRAVRARTEAICAPLAIEDHVPQPVADVSPPKWHLGHTAWFFEAFVLQPNAATLLPGYRVFDPRFGHVFNSYYEGQGTRVARAERSALSRPTVAEVLAFRAHVDAAMQAVLAQPLTPELAALIELGLQHEQQHQELLVTDLKFILGTNPLAPAYAAVGHGALEVAQEHLPQAGADDWLAHGGGVVEIGHAGEDFSFDNERPRHQALVPPVEVRRQLVTNAEYLAFMADGGYERYAFWHAEGWDWLRTLPQRAPLYWQRDAEGGEARGETRWRHYTLQGLQPLDPAAPVTHISLYEAHAFCQWAGWRLPTEFEWEAVAGALPWGQRWEWTASSYTPYPGFQPAAGAVGEYNGKFMVNQQVLRGASFATPPGHARPTYRNFFHAPLRWQYTGIRPARDTA
jgi:ergothioneine biosynthesis protein EgtB